MISLLVIGTDLFIYFKNKLYFKQIEKCEQKIAENVKIPTIHFPNEIWEEIIMWCKRTELGENVSLANDRLFCISYAFMHVEKQHGLPEIEIYGDNKNPCMIICYGDGSEKDVSKAEVPSVGLPENIIGQERSMNIYNIEDHIVQFMELLAPIQSAISLNIDDESIQKSNTIELMELMKGKVQQLKMDSFSEFYERYGFLLDDTIIMLQARCYNEMKYLKIVKDWLYKSRNDGKPKVFDTWTRVEREFIEIIKEDFVEAEEPLSFIFGFDIRISELEEDFSFNAVNSITGERLVIEHLGYEEWIIGRLPKDCANSSLEIFNDTKNSMSLLPCVNIWHYGDDYFENDDVDSEDSIS